MDIINLSNKSKDLFYTSNYSRNMLYELELK